MGGAGYGGDQGSPAGPWQSLGLTPSGMTLPVYVSVSESKSTEGLVALRNQRSPNELAVHVCTCICVCVQQSYGQRERGRELKGSYVCVTAAEEMGIQGQILARLSI